MFALPYNSEWTYFKSKIKCHDPEALACSENITRVNEQ